MIRKQNPRKNETKKRLSNVVKQNLRRHMDAYDGATIKQQIELLKKI